MISILWACNEKREREKIYNDDEGGQGGKQLSESERHLHFLIIFFSILLNISKDHAMRF